VTIWDAATNKRIKILPDDPVGPIPGVIPHAYPKFFAFSPDGKTLVGGSNHFHINVWHVVSGERTKKVEGHTRQIQRVAFAPGGELFASASGDDTIRLWDKHGTLLKVLELSSSDLAFSPDGKLLCIACPRGIMVWDVEERKETTTFPVSESERFGATRITFTPDGKTFIVCTNHPEIQLWNAESGIRQRTIALPPDKWDRSNPPLDAIALSPDGNLLAGNAGNDTVFVCDVKTGELFGELSGHESPVVSLAWYNNERLISGSRDGTAIIWDISKLRRESRQKSNVD
jgi:WD40 repeat protein